MLIREPAFSSSSDILSKTAAGASANLLHDGGCKRLYRGRGNLGWYARYLTEDRRGRGARVGPCADLGEDIPVLAWGPGFDRIIMDYYGIKDIRELYKNDLKQLREIKHWMK